MTPSLGTFVAFKISVISSFPSLQYTSILFSLHIHIYPLSFVAHCMWYHDGAFYRSSGALYRALVPSTGALVLYTELRCFIHGSDAFYLFLYCINLCQLLTINVTETKQLPGYTDHSTNIQKPYYPQNHPPPPPPPGTFLILLYDLNTTLMTML